VIFALTALILLVLFFLTYRSTRSRFSLGWTNALAFLLVGGASYLLIGTDLQAAGVVAGNALTIVGLVCSWGAARSLRLRSLAPWILVIPALIVGIATLLDNPATNAHAGAPVLFAAVVVVMVLTARELILVGDVYAGARWSLLIASSLLAAVYLVRLIAFAFNDFGSATVTFLVSEATTTVVTELVLIVVSFNMAGLSHAEVERRLRARASRSSRELSEGAQVQQKLLPDSAPDGAGYPLAGACIPSRSLSGDFFDWQMSDERMVITVGDVMGKGVGAAMLGATVRAGLRLAQRSTPGESITAVLDALGRDLTRNESFVTLFHAHLDRRTGRLSVVDAGHGLAVLVRSDGTRHSIRSANLPLGLNIDTQWDTQTFLLKEGDRLLVFSDGVLDLFDGSVTSLHRAVDIVLAAPDESFAEGAVRVITDLAEAGDREDDVTVVALERSRHPAVAPQYRAAEAAPLTGL
jgi:sigma-B regulation protein RsbU (phosphoserine phosphatase)